MARVQDVVDLQETVDSRESKALWVFGYGSLCWRPGFQFDKAVVGNICGYARKFWQGNNTHRGTKEKPGRVATLIEEEKGRVYGVAFAVSGEAAIPYLSNRECRLGGYDTHFTTFFPLHGEPMKVLLYIATPKNLLWMGDAPTPDIASQIVECNGPSGYNVEYLVRLAQFMRHHFPDVHDAHLFQLELEVMAVITSKNMCLNAFMGDGHGCITFRKCPSRNSSPERQRAAEIQRVDTFQYATTVPERSLRCLKK